MKNIKHILLFIATMLFLNSTDAFAQKNNFSGTWLMNEQKSEFGRYPVASMFKQYNVKQTADSLSVEGVRFSDGNTNTPSQPIVYPMNGQQIESIRSDKRKMTGFLQWSADQRSFTRLSKFSMPDNPSVEAYWTKDVWSLGEGGRTLLIERTYGGGNDEVTIKVLYERQ